MDRAWGRRAAFAAAAALGVAGVTASAILAPGLPPEGGFGHAAAAVRTAPAHHEGAGPAAAAASLASAPAPTLIATLSAQTPYSASPGGPPVGKLPATNPFGTPTVLAVVGQPDEAGWAQVELPIRPNGSLGWISLGGPVSLTQTAFRVVVNREADTVTVFNGATQVMQVPAAVGKPSTPTPAGNTYLWELIRPDNPHGAYGPYIFGLAMFSDAYSVFNGGDAQIGIHGQDEPWSVGHPVSHGCVRLDNSVITQLAGMLPLGTPVTIQ
ncbi:MAG TPA: L,D-transpeptidase [Acidimicrobiales bacterium]|nr:L,D-transpeptidase [Acidimicrobiales bacterium]